MFKPITIKNYATEFNFVLDIPSEPAEAIMNFCDNSDIFLCLKSDNYDKKYYADFTDRFKIWYDETYINNLAAIGLSPKATVANVRLLQIDTMDSADIAPKITVYEFKSENDIAIIAAFLQIISPLKYTKWAIVEIPRIEYATTRI